MIKNILTIKYAVIIAIAIAVSITAYVFIGTNDSEPKEEKEIEKIMKERKDKKFGKLIDRDRLNLTPRNDPPPLIKKGE